MKTLTILNNVLKQSCQVAIAVAMLVLAQACTKTNDAPPPTEIESSNVLVLNEGLFRRGNATISGYDPQTNTSLGTVFDPSVSSSGGLDILQSVTVLGDTLVLVANNSNAIVLLDALRLTEIDRFDALGSPRYLTEMQNGHFLVTDLFANRLLELAPDFSEARVVSHEGQAEQAIAFLDGALFVSPSRRAVFYYDASVGSVTDSLEMPFRANALLALDENRIAVCGGILDQGESGGLQVIDWAGKSVEYSIRFNEQLSSLYPRLAISNENLFCLQRDLFSFNLDSLSVGGDSFRPFLANFSDAYGLGIEPVTGEVYVADAKNGLDLGEVLRFTPAGIPIDSFEVGIFPNGFVFR